MSCEATTSPSRSIPRRVLPPSLHLTGRQMDNGTLRHLQDSEDSEDFSEPLNHSFHRFFHPRRLSAVERLRRVGEEIEAEKADHNIRPKNSLKRRKSHPAPPWPSVHPNVSQTTATSRISAPQCSPTTLIESFPSLNVSDIPSKSPTNKSPFSAVLLARDDEECEEDNPDELWHREQLHRARLAKLTRHLGEEIPAEMVLGPALLSRGTSCSSVYARRRGGYHHRRRSLDPTSLMQDSSIGTGVVRRSKSLKVQSDIWPILPVTSLNAEMPSKANGRTATHMVAETPNPARSPSTIPEAHPPIDVAKGDASQGGERAPIETPSKTSLHAHSVPSLSRRHSPRHTTADAARRAEKLVDFFGVDEENVSALALLHSAAHTLLTSTSTAAGNLAIDVPDSQAEVEVKISKPTRFWNNRGSTRTLHLEDVRDKLRTMKAS